VKTPLIEALDPHVPVHSVWSVVVLHRPTAKSLHVLLPEHIFIVIAAAIGFFYTFTPASLTYLFESTANLLLDHP
jgi:hypothetical protein